MIQKYKVINDRLLVDASFEVDTEIFTNEMAKTLLDENDMFWDENNNPIFELLIKYTIRIVMLCTNKDTFDIIECFNNFHNDNKILSEIKRFYGY